jgi:hypothetical protein
MNAHPKAGNERRRDAVDDPELWRFFRADGRIAAIPAKQEMRLRLLTHLAKLFERGHAYTEDEVNAAIWPLYSDYATLRRYLIDAKLLTRDHGVYRRA